jgi:hypothetical protein
MSTIAATNSSATDNLFALLRSNSAAPGTTPSPSSTAGTTSASSTTSSAGGGPATFVDLSDNTKAVLARAKSDQVVADQLRAFVVAHRVGGRGSAGGTDNAPASGTTGASSLGDFTTQDGSVYGVIVTPTEPGSAVATVVPTVDPKVSFSNQLQAGGFTVLATGDASTGTYSMQIDGPNGFHWSDQKLDPGAALGSVSGVAATDGLNGLIVSGAGPGNIETITFSENGATAVSATASSDAGTLSVSAATAQALSATVSIDFSTGTIQLNGSVATASTQSARLSLSA